MYLVRFASPRSCPNKPSQVGKIPKPSERSILRARTRATGKTERTRSRKILGKISPLNFHAAATFRSVPFASILRLTFAMRERVATTALPFRVLPARQRSGRFLYDERRRYRRSRICGNPRIPGRRCSPRTRIPRLTACFFFLFSPSSLPLFRSHSPVSLSSPFPLRRHGGTKVRALRNARFLGSRFLRACSDGLRLLPSLLPHLNTITAPTTMHFSPFHRAWSFGASLGIALSIRNWSMTTAISNSMQLATNRV